MRGVRPQCVAPFLPRKFSAIVDDVAAQLRLSNARLFGGSSVANTTVQRRVGDWVRQTWLSRRLGQQFDSREVRLTTGGSRRFSLVSADGAVVGCLYTSEARTSTGKRGSGKINHVFSDLYFLTHVNCYRRVLVFAEQSMADLVEEEARRGLIPRDIEIMVCDLPEDIRIELSHARRKASSEVGG